MESSKFGRALSVPRGTTKAPLGARHNSRNPWKTKQDGEKGANLLRCSPQYLAKRFFGLFFFFCYSSQEAWVSESRHMAASRLQRWGRPMTVGRRWVTDAPADQRSGPAQQQNHSFNLTFNTLVNGAAATEQALCAHYENTLTDNKSRWHGGGKNKKKSQRAQAQGSWSISQQTMLERVASEIAANAVQLESHVRSFLQSAVLT